MDPLTGYILAGAGSAMLGQMFRPDMPSAPYAPNYAPPDMAPSKMFNRYTGWQNEQRNQMLKDFYGGRMYKGNGKMPGEPDWYANERDDYKNMMEEFDREHRDENRWLEYNNFDLDETRLDDPGGDYQGPGGDSWIDQLIGGKDKGGKGGVSPTRSSVDMVGNKPVNQWVRSQMDVYKEGDKSFRPEFNDYLAERGIKNDGNVQGAQTEHKKDFAQLRRDIAAQAANIKMNTLGQMFGEVSDAGPQMAGMVGAIGQAGQMANQQRDQQYQMMLQKYQYDLANQQPGALQMLAGIGGQTLPYLLGGLGSNQTGYGGQLVDNTAAVPQPYQYPYA